MAEALRAATAKRSVPMRRAKASLAERDLLVLFFTFCNSGTRGVDCAGNDMLRFVDLSNTRTLAVFVLQKRFRARFFYKDSWARD